MPGWRRSARCGSSRRHVELTKAAEGLGQVGVVGGVARVAGDRPENVVGGAAVVPLLQGDHAEQVQRVGMLGLSLQDVADSRAASVRRPRCNSCKPSRRSSLMARSSGERWVAADLPPWTRRLDRPAVVALLVGDQTEQVQGFRVLRLLAQDGPVEQGRLRETTLAMMLERQVKRILHGCRSRLVFPGARPHTCR